MLQQRTIAYTHIIHRYFKTTSVIENQKYMVRFMKKLMNQNTPKRKWYPGTAPKPQHSFEPNTMKKINPQVKQRVNVLNKIFMTHVTDLMATGEVSSEISGRGVEISHVNVANDFHVVRVYWFSSDNNVSRIDETSKLLDQIAYRLRHELSQLRVIGVVPPIIFVKDKSVAARIELEKRIAEADYGEDFVPTVKMPPKKPELMLFTKLPEDVRVKILECSKNDGQEEGEVEEEENYDFSNELPPMKHNVLGLNHAFIMNKITQSLNKARMVNVQSEHSGSLDVRKEFNPQSVKMLQSNEEMKAFDEFLLKRQIEERRREKWELRNAEDDIITDENENDDWNEFNDEDYHENNDPFEDLSPDEIYR